MINSSSCELLLLLLEIKRKQDWFLRRCAYGNLIWSGAFKSVVLSRYSRTLIRGDPSKYFLFMLKSLKQHKMFWICKFRVFMFRASPCRFFYFSVIVKCAYEASILPIHRWSPSFSLKTWYPDVFTTKSRGKKTVAIRTIRRGMVKSWNAANEGERRLAFLME